MLRMQTQVYLTSLEMLCFRSNSANWRSVRKLRRGALALAKGEGELFKVPRRSVAVEDSIENELRVSWN